MLNDIMLNITYKPFMMSVVMLNVVEPTYYQFGLNEAILGLVIVTQYMLDRKILRRMPGTVTEHSAHYPKVKGLSQATATWI
jgi:hypothetical protein